MNHKAWGFGAKFNFWRYREGSIFFFLHIENLSGSVYFAVLPGNRLKAIFWGFVAWRKSRRAESLFLGHVMVQGLPFNEKNFPKIFNKPK